MDFLVKQILEKDPGAIQTAKEMGSRVSEFIKPMTGSEDEGVRQIALRALNRSGGGSAEIFTNALLDRSPSVRAAALSGLQQQSDPETYSRLLRTYENVSDPQHRQEIAMMLADKSGANLNDLRLLYEREENIEAREGFLVALAKLGDRKSQVEFLQRLMDAKGDELKRFLEYVEYLGQIWALHGLGPALKDKTPLVGSPVCIAGVGISELLRDFPEYLRACDWALNLIAKIARAGFSFAVSKAKNYADAQLAEASRFLDTLPQVN